MKLISMVAMLALCAGCKGKNKDPQKSAAETPAAAAPAAPSAKPAPLDDGAALAAFRAMPAAAVFGATPPEALNPVEGTASAYMMKVTSADALALEKVTTCPMSDARCVQAVACPTMFGKHRCDSHKLEIFVDVAATPPELVLAAYTIGGEEEVVTSAADIERTYASWHDQAVDEDIRASEGADDDEVADGDQDIEGGCGDACRRAQGCGMVADDDVTDCIAVCAEASDGVEAHARSCLFAATSCEGIEACDWHEQVLNL